MTKKDKKKEEKPKDKSFSAFLKKRAPIYLGLTGLFLVFAVPELTSNDLQGLFPEDLTEDEKQILDLVMSYNGPNNEGLTILEGIDMKMKEEFSDRVYNDKSSQVQIQITNNNPEHSDLVFVFESDSKSWEYIWRVNPTSEEIIPTNNNAKVVTDLVDFYD